MIIYDSTWLVINIMIIIFVTLLSLTTISFFIIYLIYYFFPLLFKSIGDYFNKVREIDNG